MKKNHNVVERSNSMDIRQLKYFIAVVQNQGYSRAAEAFD